MKKGNGFLWAVVSVAILVFSGCSDEGEVKTSGSGSGSSTIILFASDTSSDGNLGGSRAVIDAFCTGSSNKPSGYSNVRAFISIDAADEIRDMPTNYGVPTGAAIKSPGETTIFTDWADMLDDSGIDDSLENYGVLPSFTSWWSGSDAFGALDTNHCTNWTDGAAGDGSYGASDMMGTSEWIQAFSMTGCTNIKFVLCLAY